MSAPSGATERGPTVRPWEDPVTFWESFRIRWAGWTDRVRMRDVADDKLTHYLHELQERAQGYQVSVLEWSSAEDERLEVTIAELNGVLAATITLPGSPTSTQLDTDDGKERARWASDRRAAVRDAAEHARKKQEQDQARDTVERLRTQRAGLAELRDIHFAQCRQWFDQRAAKYNRARTGWFGLKVNGEPRIPVFVPVSFVGSRPQDIREIGDPDQYSTSSSVAPETDVPPGVV